LLAAVIESPVLQAFVGCLPASYLFERDKMGNEKDYQKWLKGDSKMKKEKPIAILTINEDVSKMNKKEFNRLRGWLFGTSCSILREQEQYGKCRFRLMKGGKK